MAVGVVPAQAADAPAVGKLRPRARVRFRLVLVAVIVSSLTATAAVQFLNTERAAAGGYDAARTQLQAAVERAQLQCYSADELTSITSGLAADRNRVTRFLPNEPASTISAGPAFWDFCPA